MNKTVTLRTLEAASVILFFLQALRVIFSILFGIIYDQVFEGPIDTWLYVSVLLVVIALVASAAIFRKPKSGFLALLAAVAVVSRIGLTVNDPAIRYWSSVAVLVAGGLYIAALFSVDRSVFAPGILLAIALDQTFRTAGYTYDVTLRPGWMPIQVLWALVMLALVIRLSNTPYPGEPAQGGPKMSWGLALGGFLFMETSLLSLPNGVARWSDWSYEVSTLVLLGITLLFLFPGVRERLLVSLSSSRAAYTGVTALMLAGLMLGYFLTGAVAASGLFVAQAAALALLVCLLDDAGSEKESPGLALAIGLVFFLILNFFNAFAFTYPYTLTFMKGLGWGVYLVAGLLFGLGVLAHKPSGEISPEIALRPSWVALMGLVLMAVSIVFVRPREATPMPESGSLRIATYNIHYGYDEVWHLSLEEIAQTIEESGADIVAMQEVDTGRMTSYLVDNAYYLSRRLNMNVAYLPAVEHLTGIGLLYRGPAESIEGKLVTSSQEQTGIVHVQVSVNGQPLHAFGIWLGLSNEDTVRQATEAVEFIGDRNPAVFGGDFNAVPGSPVAEVIEGAGFIDPFVALGVPPDTFTAPSEVPEKRIDYVWLREATPVDAWVPESLASDHRMVVVEIELSP